VSADVKKRYGIIRLNPEICAISPHHLPCSDFACG
jgi:hypothetical protein